MLLAEVDMPSCTQIRQAREKWNDAQERVLDAINRLQDKDTGANIYLEMEKMTVEFAEAQDRDVWLPHFLDFYEK